MEVIKFLNSNSIETLMLEHHIKVRDYPEDGVMVLNYDMIEASKFDNIVRECRSLILENVVPYNVVSRSFYRFFNVNECPLTDLINFDQSVVWEKVDGSIINVYFHNGEWKCSTRSMANAEGATVSGHIFKDIIDGIMHLPAFDSLGLSARDKTFVFELVSPKSRVVKPYPEDDVYLLAIIDKFTGVEYNLLELNEVADILDIRLPAYVKLNNYKDVQNLIDKCDAMDEGFVIADYSDMANVHRIKMKNPSYLAIAHLRENGSISPKRISILVWENDYDEYLGYFPEDRQFFTPYINAFGLMIKDIDELLIATKDIVDQKEYAMAVKDTPVAKIMFQIRNGMTLDKIQKKLFTDTKLRILNRYIKN